MINWTKAASIDFGCMPGLTPTRISQNHNGKSLRWIHNGGKSQLILWTLNEPWSQKKKMMNHSTPNKDFLSCLSTHIVFSTNKGASLIVYL